MSLFDEQFYPTPGRLVDQMMKPLIKELDWPEGLREKYGHRLRSIGNRRVLEPSAGKGDILDWLKDHYHMETRRTICVEIDPDLRFTLQGKGYKVVDADFLAYDGTYFVDLIVMNPPFAQGVAHLLHAWEILQAGDIACVLNAETLRNPYTEKRKLLGRLIEAHGNSDFVGQPFLEAERPSDVEVALVWLHKERVAASGNGFGDLGLEMDAQLPDEEFAANPLAHADIIESLVARYQAAQRILVQKHELEKLFNFYVRGICWSFHDNPRSESAVEEEEKSVENDLNEAVDELKKKFWQYVFNKTRLGEVTTSKFQRKFDEFSEQTARLAFSVANIKSILQMFFLNREQIMEECLLNVFDTATKYHEKNKVHVEGWKTNKSYRVNRKVIVPNGVEISAIGWNLRWGYSRDFFMDFDKTLCYLDGRDIATVGTIADAIERRFIELNRGSGLRYEASFISHYFEIRVFKKGTVHLTFLDDYLWHELNKRAAEGKNWIGGGY